MNLVTCKINKYLFWYKRKCDLQVTPNSNQIKHCGSSGIILIRLDGWWVPGAVTRYSDQTWHNKTSPESWSTRAESPHSCHLPSTSPAPIALISGEMPEFLWNISHTATNFSELEINYLHSLPNNFKLIFCFDTQHSVFSLHGLVAKLKRCDSVIYVRTIHSTFFLFVIETLAFLVPS